MKELVVLVDEHDGFLGSCEKLEAHESGLLHRAVSVLVFDEEERLLLQRRAHRKYHSGGLWSNTCCGHPRPDESVEDAGHRRLREEMGFDCPLTPALSVRYRSVLENGLVENELDHVLVGRFSGSPTPNPDEVADWRWEPVGALLVDVGSTPERYTAWFPLVLRGFLGVSGELARPPLQSDS